MPLITPYRYRSGKHARGRTKPYDLGTKKKARRKMAKASRRRNFTA